MIIELIESLGAWTWWLIGLLLLAVEIVAPGFFFLWFGIAALIIGVSAFLIDWPWQMQIVGFAILSVVAALVGRRVLGNREISGDAPDLNARAARLIGRELRLAEAIDDGSGRVRIDDSLWRVRGPELPAGSSVRVTGVDGSVLIVEAVGIGEAAQAGA